MSVKKNGFLNHSKNYLIAEFFNKAIAFITIPIFTRLLLPEEYGILAIYTSIIGVSKILLGLNFHGAVARRFYEKDSKFSNFLATNLIFILVFNIIVIFLLYIFKEYGSSFFIISSNLFFIAIVISSLSFFIEIELTILQASQQSGKYAIISVVRSVLITATAIIWVYLLKEDRYLGRIYSQFYVTSIFFIFVLVHLIKQSEMEFDVKYIKYSLFYGIPLIPHALSGFILAQFDRIIINQISGSYETGLYSFAYNIGMIMNVVVLAMNKSWIPIFYNNLSKKEYGKIQELAETYAKIIFIIALGLIFFSREIIMIMADKKYFEAMDVVPIIVLGYVAVFLYTLYGNYSFFRKKTGLISLFTFIAGFLNIGLNYLFIPKYGYTSAAWTTLIAYIVLFLLHYINSKFILKEKTIMLPKIFYNLLLFFIVIFLYLSFNFDSSFIQFLYKSSLILVLGFIYFRKQILGKFYG